MIVSFTAGREDLPETDDDQLAEYVPRGNEAERRARQALDDSDRAANEAGNVASSGEKTVCPEVLVAMLSAWTR